MLGAGRFQRTTHQGVRQWPSKQQFKPFTAARRARAWETRQNRFDTLATRAMPSRKGDVLLLAETISKSHDGDKILFSGLTFSVVAGDKIAIVGPNGCGKSSLLKVVAGLDYSDAPGTISRNKGAKVAYLAQEPVFKAGITVLQAVLQSDSPMARAVQDYQAALAHADGKITKELEAAIERMNSYNAWEIDAEAKRLLEAVGIADPNQSVDGLSGGQRKRVALASSLLGRPDLLVLDEPTNHMDVDMIGWMEAELAREDLAVVLVTHDRYFMERVCDRILELDKGKCYMHDFGGPGSYDMFKEAREFRRNAQAAAAADARTLFRREAEWMARQPKARQAKSQARINKFYELSTRSKDVPAADTRADFGTMKMVRQGNKVVRLDGLSYQVSGKQLIKDFTYDFMPGDRLGIAGRNGTGKSTLLDLIAGLRTAQAGRREVGDTTLIGYFAQHPPPVRPDLRIIDYLREVADDRRARSAGLEPLDSPEVVLERVGFSRKQQFQKVESLSGGERRRLHLASVLIERPNLLILDEPTNDLDLATVEVLEETLKSFQGVLLVVSHDRAFMDNVTDRLLVLKGDGLVRMFDGKYNEYLELMEEDRRQKEAAQLEQQLQQQQAAAKAAAQQQQSSSSSNGSSKEASASSSSSSSSSSTATATAVKAPPKKRKLGYYEDLEYKKLTTELDTLGAKRDALNERVVALAQSGTDFEQLEKLSLELADLSADLDNKTERWFELAEIAGDI